MKFFQKVFALGYMGIILLFIATGVALIFFSMVELWHALSPFQSLSVRDRFNGILESIGLLTIALVALELGQTIMEEEVQREAQVSAPTRVRRFLSRFMVVVIVALSIEALVSVFELAHKNPAYLPHAAAVAVAAGALLVAWGIFIRMNTSAEMLEPEALEKAKREDKKFE